MCVKVSNIFIGLKMTCLGVLDRGERDNDNETGLKEGRGIQIETTVLPLRDARFLRFKILTLQFIEDDAKMCTGSIVNQQWPG